MKRSLPVVIAIALVSFAVQGRCDTIVNLTGGTIDLCGPDICSTTLFAPGYIITNAYGDDDAVLTIGIHCQNGCTPEDIEDFATQVWLVSYVPNGAMVVNGELFGMFGGPTFTAATFHSWLDPSGVLRVFGEVTTRGSFNECDINSLDGCGNLPNPIDFAFGNTQWIYHGTFVPDFQSGLFDLSEMTIVSTPEPGTILLFLTALPALMARVRSGGLHFPCGWQLWASL